MRQSASLPWIGRRRTRVRYSSSVSFSGMSSSQLPEASAGTESSDCNSNSASTASMLGLAGLSGSAARFAASAAAMASARALALAASDAAFAACTFSLASSAAALAASSRLAWSSGGSGTGGGCATSPSGILLPGSPAAKFTTRHARRFDGRIGGRLTGAHIVEARMVAIGIGGKSALIRVSRIATRALCHKSVPAWQTRGCRTPNVQLPRSNLKYAISDTGPHTRENKSVGFQGHRPSHSRTRNRRNRGAGNRSEAALHLLWTFSALATTDRGGYTSRLTERMSA